MVETVVDVKLPVNESIKIKKNRLLPFSKEDYEKRLSIVTGIHGDELEGQYVCYELIRRIMNQKEHLLGIVDIYPTLNPLGIESATRDMPMFDLDMNRIFPGSQTGAVAEHIAAKIIEDIEGSSMCLDIHASTIFIHELPQVRMNKTFEHTLMPYAKLLHTDFIWLQEPSMLLDSTLDHALNERGVPTVVIEMGAGMRITKAYGNKIVEGIFCLMKAMGMWSGEVMMGKEPFISSEGEMIPFHAKEAGVFLSKLDAMGPITKGEVIGEVVNPLTGGILEQFVAPDDGVVFSLREHPIVYHGSLVARFLGGVK
jgi:hypothetical protein